MNRVSRVNELLKRELSGIFIREIDFPENALVTITRVEAPADLRTAIVYVSVLPENKSRETMRVLDQAAYGLQRKINKRLKMKSAPKIEFREEKRTAEAEKIEKLLLEP